MKVFIKTVLSLVFLVFLSSCLQNKNTEIKKMKNKTAAEILGNPEYLAISYGGYRQNTRDVQPTITEIKDDMKLLSAMGIKILRTYNVHLAQAENILKAIDTLQKEDSNFEMYVMLGVWIDCKNAWTDQVPVHSEESSHNETEINKAIVLANQYSHIVKIIAVGNEAMVHWATAYYVEPWVILKWVNYLQDLKKQGKLNKDLWITSSDNFASWGGGEREYRTKDLNDLIKAVDYVSMHTYPMHDTHYNPVFWGILPKEIQLSKEKQVQKAMQRSLYYAKTQYNAVQHYMDLLGVEKPLHIGETGWASFDTKFYGDKGSKAIDEYKSGVYYQMMREWTNKNGISCFYFEGFDEPWKDVQNVGGSENNFGLFKTNGEAKYAIWNLVDKGVFDGLTRDGNKIKKTFDGDLDKLLKYVKLPQVKEFELIEN